MNYNNKINMDLKTKIQYFLEEYNVLLIQEINEETIDILQSIYKEREEIFYIFNSIDLLIESSNTNSSMFDAILLNFDFIQMQNSITDKLYTVLKDKKAILCNPSWLNVFFSMDLYTDFDLSLIVIDT